MLLTNLDKCDITKRFLLKDTQFITLKERYVKTIYYGKNQNVHQVING